MLLVYSDTGGFIHNDVATIQRNIIEIGDINSILISRYCRALVGEYNIWLQLMREIMVDKM